MDMKFVLDILDSYTQIIDKDVEEGVATVEEGEYALDVLAAARTTIKNFVHAANQITEQLEKKAREK